MSNGLASTDAIGHGMISKRMGLQMGKIVSSTLKVLPVAVLMGIYGGLIVHTLRSAALI